MNNIQFDQKIKGSQRRPLQSVRSGCVGRVFIALMAIIFVMGFVSAAQAGFTYRKAVTVHNSQVSGGTDFPDFPVAVIINNDSDLMTTALGGHVEHALGYDIVFKDTGGTQLDYEIEQYDGTTGSLIAWVEVPSLKVGTDTVIYIYYGDSSISGPTHTPTAVWDISDGWQGVWHLYETGGDAQDSTFYDRDGTVSGTVTRGANGQIDGSYDFGSYGRVDIGDPNDDHLDFGTGNFTVSFWLNVDQSTGSDQVALYKGAYGSGGASSEDVYYFDGYGAERWENYPNMTDGGTVQHAWTSNSGGVQLLDHNTSGGGGGGGWTSPTGIVGEACGDYSAETYFIDGDTNTGWGCEDTDYHWIKLDMGESKSMTKFRIYNDGDIWADRWSGIGAYVSDNPANWGAPVFTDWDIPLNSGWYESPEFSKSGRYIYLLSADRVEAVHMKEFEAAVGAEADSGGIISKVELRAHGAAFGGSPNNDDMILRPVFTSADATVLVDRVSTGQDDNAPITISHQTSGSDRLMLVATSFNNDAYEKVVSVKYNGVDLDFEGSDQISDDSRVEIWSMVAPPVGTYDVVVTYDGNGDGVWAGAIAGVITFNGVDQSTPLGSIATNTGTSGNATVDVTSAVNELVFAVVAFETSSDVDPGSGQSEHWDITYAGGGDIYGGGSTKAGAASVTMLWEPPWSGPDWAIAGIPIKGVPSDGDDHQVDMGDYDNGGKVWSEWVDITNDTNAPATWSWDDVANLDCDAQFVVVGDRENMLCSLVEIRVTTGGSADPGYSLTTDSSGQNMVFQISDGSGITASPAAGLTNDTWHHIVGVVDRSADRIRIYKDGTEVGSGTDIAAIGSVDSTENLLFPWGASGDYDLDGLLDEVRISNTARSADWIMTEYNNQSSPATFHTIGAEEGLALTYTISAVAGANGGISPSGAVSVPADESQTFSITTDMGYVILDVLVDGLSAGAVSSYTFTNVNADHTISASFIQPGDWVIYTTAIGNGSISPAGPVAVIEGDSQQFDITPDGGEQIDEVWVDDVPIGAVTSYTFSNVTADHTIKAQFTETPPSEDLTDCVQISDTPLDAQFRSAPANIMFLLDDSGSMDWEFMNSDASEEMFEGSKYVFDNPGDNGSGDILSDSGRKHWKSQWSGYNSIYYNTHTTYEPWPSTTLDTFGPADTSTPRSHPQYAIPMFDLRDEYTQIIDGAAVISVTRAHYYTWHDVNEDGVLDAGETRYLVNFVGSFPGGNLNAREWYVFNDVNADDVVQGNELTPISASSVPVSVKPKSFGDDLQNFANWYSYYRRRELTAIATVASVITHAQGMQVGLYSIHGRINITVQKIKVDGVDETATLLHELYANYNSADMTPLRTGLLSIGKYFHKNDSDDGGIGPSPYADADDGGECQQSFVIVMTDGYYNGDEPWNPAKNYDGDNGEPYADSYSNTLADIAMYYYENDLVSELGDSVPMNDRDTATHQHMVTYGIGFGVDGVLNPSQIDFESGIYPVWPNPTGGDQEKIDDLWHASVNGRGRFFSAKNYNELIADLLSILQDIQLMGASASAVSVNGDELYMKINSDVLMFQSKYYSEAWHGDVLAFRLNDVTGEIIEPAVWSAAQRLSSQTADSRKIVTFDGDSAGMPFRFTDLEDQQKSLLDLGWQSDGGALAQNIVDYLRGDPSNEQDNGGSFRNRTWSILDPGHPYDGNIITSSKLGDIVHSSPVYKNGMLYWGGNDGMLHAVEASTGEELFAYVPNLVFKNFADLTDPAYLHKYYVDLTPTVKNVDISGVTTMLVGGLGKGGRGYFALDVSNMKPLEGSVPSSENEVAAMAMWEYPNLNTPSEEITDLGYSFSKATIVESYDTDDAPSIVIFGNGYNSPNGHAVLFILNPLTGELIKKIDTQAGSCNGLSTPIATDVNYDGKVDYVYAGDLDGNLWKFDLTDSDYNNWDVAYNQGGVSRPLFETDDQPITTKPNVMYHCEEDGYMVIFGTGRYLGIDDLSDSSQQAIYGIWDYGDDVDDGEYVGSFNSGVLTGNNLTGSVSVLAQTVVNEQTVNDTNLRVLSENDPDWMTSTTDGVSCGEALGVAKCDLNGVGQDADPLRNVGWYLNLPASRERVVSDVLVKDGKLIVVSFMPDASMCGTGGSSWLMTMNACSGDRFQEAQFDTNGDGVIDDQDLINIGTAQDPIMVPPTGIEYAGRLQPPAIIVLENGQEILHMSSSSGEIKSVTEKSADLGITFWKVFRP